MKRQLYALAVVVAAFAAALLPFLALSPDDEADAATGEPVETVRADSHRLSEPAESELTVVEFLDFECEACGAMYPIVERLREEYGDRVTFVARYFPMPGHRNAEPAARPVEAAAGQGRFEDMYDRLFTTQAEWGEAQESREDVFRGFVAELGLDMAAYDTAVAAQETAERVRADVRDGLALGVQGTPTFFLDDQLVQTPWTYEDFAALIENRLG
ncbi:DsbA family protein [Streptomyces mayteni]